MSRINAAITQHTWIRLFLASAILIAGLLPLASAALHWDAGSRIAAPTNEGAAISALSDRLNSSDAATRQAAAEALAVIGSPAALRALIAPLAAADLTPARHTAMRGLELAGSAAIAPLTDALKSANPILRRNAAEMLGFLPAAAATPALSRALRDADPTVRAQAAWALSEIATPAAQQALRRAADAEREPLTRRAVETALAHAAQGTAETSLATLAGALAGAPTYRWLVLAAAIILAALILWSRPRLLPPAGRRGNMQAAH
jgi:HEAT repeat protein